MIKFDNKCTGCKGCEQICPKEAIGVKNIDGFWYPRVNTELCIDCGLCDKICHYQAENKIQGDRQAFAVKNKDFEIRLKSSSGGMFYALAKNVIENGGVVFGACFDDNMHLVHGYTEKIEDLDKFLTSKYLQSDCNGSFSKAKEFLNKERQVIYCGTPCMINGLKNYLRKSYYNLILVDFICHGVPDPIFFDKYIKELEEQNQSKIVSFNFRNKEIGWTNFSEKICFENGKLSTIPHQHSPYMTLFLRNIILRESCYECSAKGDNRCADITLADFWGVKEAYPDLFDDNGVSLVIINSGKGEKLFDNICGDLQFNQVDLDLATKYNSAYHNSVRKPEKARRKVYSNANKYSTNELVSKYVKNNSFANKIKRILVRIYRKIKYSFKKPNTI